MEWAGWECKPNRYGFYGFICKNKPSGSGTTHSNRKEARKHLQWEWLTGQDHPGPKQCLEKHKAELEKALEKANAKLESLENDSSTSTEEEEQTAAASSSSSVNYRRRSTKKRKSAASKSLEKDQPEQALECRRGRVAKDGKKEILQEVEEDQTLKSVWKQAKKTLRSLPTSLRRRAKRSLWKRAKRSLWEMAKRSLWNRAKRSHRKRRKSLWKRALPSPLPPRGKSPSQPWWLTGTTPWGLATGSPMKIWWP